MLLSFRFLFKRGVTWLSAKSVVIQSGDLKGSYMKMEVFSFYFPCGITGMVLEHVASSLQCPIWAFVHTSVALWRRPGTRTLSWKWKVSIETPHPPTKKSYFVWTMEPVSQRAMKNIHKQLSGGGPLRPGLVLQPGGATRRSQRAPPQPSRPRGVREEPGKANRCEPNDGQRKELHRGRGLCEHVAANVGETAGMARKCVSRDGRTFFQRSSWKTARTASWRDAQGLSLQLQMFCQRDLSHAFYLRCSAAVISDKSVNHTTQTEYPAPLLAFRRLANTTLDIGFKLELGKPKCSFRQSCRPSLVFSRVRTSECAISRSALHMELAANVVFTRRRLRRGGKRHNNMQSGASLALRLLQT